VNDTKSSQAVLQYLHQTHHTIMTRFPPVLLFLFFFVLVILLWFYSSQFSTDAQEKVSVEKHLAEACSHIVQGDAVKARRSFSKAIFTNPSVITLPLCLRFDFHCYSVQSVSNWNALADYLVKSSPSTVSLGCKLVLTNPRLFHVWLLSLLCV
jgi:hypothetical protein